MKHRAVITGIGVIAPNGIGKSAYWKAISNGESGIRRVSRFDPVNYPSKYAGEVVDFNPSEYIEKRKLQFLSRFAQFALVSTRMAIEDASINVDDYDPHRIGIALGNSLGGKEIEELQWQCHQACEGSVDPTRIPGVNTNFAVGALAAEFGIKGPNVNLSTACTSALNAIAFARELIVGGNVDIMVAGGSETPIVPSVFDAFCSSGSLSRREGRPETVSRPFDKNRDGFIMAEGCGIVIIESLEHALARNAHIYAEIAGYGATNDAYSLLRMEPTGKEAAEAIKGALHSAGMQGHEIDYINAHGSSSQVADKRETNAIKEVFGDHAYKLSVSSVKSTIGQPLGAAGSLQVIAAVLAIGNGCVPPTINYEEADPSCDLDYTPNKAAFRTINAALVNCFGQGGNNVSMILKKYEPELVGSAASS